jgi:hypothetical protein
MLPARRAGSTGRAEWGRSAIKLRPRALGSVRTGAVRTGAVRTGAARTGAARTGAVVSQLRRRARGRSARGGLAGRSRACKGGLGLALQRADGDRQRARDVGASNRAGAVCHTPRGGSQRPGCARLEGRRQPVHNRQRERERERDASMPMHLPTDPCGRAVIPVTSDSPVLTRRQPLIVTTRPLSQESRICALSRPAGTTQTRSMVPAL